MLFPRDDLSRTLLLGLEEGFTQRGRRGAALTQHPLLGEAEFPRGFAKLLFEHVIKMPQAVEPAIQADVDDLLVAEAQLASRVIQPGAVDDFSRRLAGLLFQEAVEVLEGAAGQFGQVPRSLGKMERVFDPGQSLGEPVRQELGRFLESAVRKKRVKKLHEKPVEMETEVGTGGEVVGPSLKKKDLRRGDFPSIGKSGGVPEKQGLLGKVALFPILQNYGEKGDIHNGKVLVLIGTEAMDITGSDHDQRAFLQRHLFTVDQVGAGAIFHPENFGKVGVRMQGKTGAVPEAVTNDAKEQVPVLGGFVEMEPGQPSHKTMMFI